MASSLVCHALWSIIAPLAQLSRYIDELNAQLAVVDARHRVHPVSQRLAAVPGVGSTIALMLATKVDPSQFRSARHFAAWLGLTPKERSTGGGQRLGGISRAGNEPASRTPCLTHRRFEAGKLFGARLVEPIWASDRLHGVKQVGRTTALVPYAKSR